MPARLASHRRPSGGRGRNSKSWPTRSAWKRDGHGACPPKALNNPEGAHHSLVSAFGRERLRDTPEDHSGITTPRADDFEERAAIREFDGGETRQEADAGAREDIKLLQRSKAELLSNTALSPPAMSLEKRQ